MKNEYIKRILIFFIGTILVFCTMWSCSHIVNAEVPASQKVVGHEATWTGYAFDYTQNGKYYTIQDATGIPEGSFLAPHFFFTIDHEKFYTFVGKEGIATILNYVLGVISDTNELDDFFTNFMRAINLTEQSGKYISQGLYDSNDNFLGYAINDISGCYYGENPPSINYNDTFVDNVGNFYQYNYASTVPDYITVTSISKDTILSNTLLNSDEITTLNNIYDIDHFYANAVYDITNAKYDCYYCDYNSMARGHIYKFPNYCNLVCSDNTWGNFCSFYKLKTGSILGYADLLTNRYSSYIGLLLYNNGSFATSLYDYYWLLRGTHGAPSGKTGNNIKLGVYDNKIFMLMGKNQTIYKDSTVLNNVINQTYTSNQYVTDSYNNYDSNNDNSFNTDVVTTQQALVYNQTIYNNYSQNFYQYVDENNNIDNSQFVEDITNTTNNYYEEGSGGGGDNPDNPDNLDNPDNNQTLDEILRAILRFFNAIGDIIGTLLASIINLIDSVLEALAGVIEDLTGASDLFASVFAWIPEPVPQILGAGFGICLVCGIIKFIRG